MIELLTACAIFMVMMALLLSALSSAGSIWQKADGQKQRQASGRTAMAMITRDIQAALLNSNASTNLIFYTYLSGAAGSWTRTNSDAAAWYTSSPANSINGGTTFVGYAVNTNDSLIRSHFAMRSGSLANSEVWDNVSEIFNLPIMGSTTSPVSFNPVADDVIALWIKPLGPDGNEVIMSTNTVAEITSVDVTLVTADSKAQEAIKRGAFSVTYANRGNWGALATNQGVQYFNTRVELPGSR